MATKKIAIDPFNRLEGDLRVEITFDDNRVIKAKSSGILFRGFERMLPDRDPMDAIVFTPRICGICSASHGVAAAKTLADALSQDLPANAYLMRNLILGLEVVMSHLSHFYVLFAPDLTNPLYEGMKQYQALKGRFAPMHGTSLLRAIKARQSALEIMGLVAGKWPNTLAIHPSGTTSTMTLSSLTRTIGILKEFILFLESHFLGCSLDEWLDLDSYEKLDRWLGKKNHENSDLGLFITSSLALALDRLGEGPGRYLCYGAYDQPDTGNWLPAGFYDGKLHPFDQELIREHISSSFFRDAVPFRHPLEGITTPYANKMGAYSWAKAPRYDGKTVEVGPLARMIIASEPLVLDLTKEIGVNVLTRMLARLQEMVKLTRQIAIWLDAIKPSEPFYSTPSTWYRRSGVGLTESARGALGHWMKTSSNLIESYQVITPSAWNMSPRDAEGNPGPIEEALQNVVVKDRNNPVEINHIIRSLDPCMSCTVH